MAIELTTWIDGLKSGLDTLIQGWYYIFVPVVILILYKIHKLQKKVNLMYNYAIDNIIEEGKNPEVYKKIKLKNKEEK